MAKIYKLQIENNDPLKGVNEFFRKLLTEKVVDALLVPQYTPTEGSIVQTLVRDPEEISGADPFAPLLLTNSATLVGQVTLDKPEEKIGAVLRSCEIRALIELSKLKQACLDNLIIIGVDCMGTFEAEDYKYLVKKHEAASKCTAKYLSKSSKGEADLSNERPLRVACQACEYPSPENTDIALSFFGCDIDKEMFVQAAESLEGINLEKLGVVAAESVSAWEEVSKRVTDKRIKFRDELFKEVAAETKDIKMFLKQLEQCRRCYNCRKECPICYCRECIFDSKTFEHESEQYLNWAERKGRIRMPTDILLFHLTRMNHMVISCVGCGQCTSACPNGIEVGKFFKSIAFKVQGLFDYKAGRNAEEEIPQATFKEDEFGEVGEGS